MTWLENPSVYAAEYLIPAGPPQPAQDWPDAMLGILADLAQTLMQDGCRLIGHIKALARGVPEGHLYASLVSPEQGPALRGELPAELLEVRLTINLIVYEFEQERLPKLVEGCIRSRLPGAVRVGAGET